MIQVPIKKLHEEAIIPERQTALASGFDLHALDVLHIKQSTKSPYYITDRPYYLFPGERALVRTGIAVEMYEGIEAQVRPRSGLAWKNGISLVNPPGTIDADYTGDIGVLIINLGNEPFLIRKGDRIAQLVFAPVLHDLELKEASELAKTLRGEGSYGHTGQ